MSEIHKNWRQIMFQTQLITAVTAWEWQLKIEAEKQNNLKGEPHEAFFVEAPRPRQKEQKSILGQVFRQDKISQPVYCGCAYEPCQEAKPV
jgi:hypothetical protein